MVTGAGRDIGAAAALKLASEGANVAVNYFASSAGADNVVAKIKANGGNAISLQGDLTKQEDVDALVGKTIAEASLEHWMAVMNLNLTSTFMMTKACLAHMDKSTIVNLASQAARDGGGPGSVPYVTSKGAIVTMTGGLAKELGPKVRVNALCPGMIDTDFHNIHTPDAGRRGFEANAPVKRQGNTDDVANLVLFLACEDSAFITGANTDINGGMVFS
ncbi:SDR family oxidoreductase [Ascidiaceihabitans sp.]|uniref:SDR family NAD(P)-dependent oxidoreductase n=1 Tax=Ascidiaceihabitans sp. TaxID=1872644 RepID=UPI00329939AB